MNHYSKFAIPAAFLLLSGCGGDLVVASDSCPNPVHQYYPGGTCACDSGGGCTRTPETETVPHADKLDLLFVVNNGAGMADKQIILAKSLPAFITRLVNPRCVDGAGHALAKQPAAGTDACPGGQREFQPVTDMHLGVITSSIGAHGGDLCDGPAGSELNPNDRAQLLPTVRDGLPSYQGSGFLSFDATGEHGLSEVAGLISDLQTTVLATGNSGCKFQAPLEAMSRFLIAAKPPKAIQVASGEAHSSGVNDELLAQRAAFLRPDSALAIVLLSDEDDCSIKDSGDSWTAASSARLPPASSACAADPFDACCRSCAASESQPPSGCGPLSDDTGCAPYLEHSTLLAAHDDATSLRCFNQKARFGVDWLTPFWNYQDQLTSLNFINDENQIVANPLFAAHDGVALRQPSWVSVAVITGVPWQDLASAESLAPGHPLEYPARGLDGDYDWRLVLNALQSNEPPNDPFMVSSVEPRDAGLQNSVTGDRIAPADSLDPRANPINGHEHRSPARVNLQYACTFTLPQPRECSAGDPHCSCAPTVQGSLDAVLADNSPLCQRPAGGAAESTQYYAGAYPSTRSLYFAHFMESRAVAGSICPKTLDETAVDYGYQPVLQALVATLTPALN